MTDNLKDNGSSIDLTKAYEKANLAVLNVVENAHVSTVRDLKLIVNKQLNRVNIELDKLNEKVIKQATNEGKHLGYSQFEKSISKIYNGRAFTEKDLSNPNLDEKQRNIADRILHGRQQSNASNNVYRQSFLEIRSNLTAVSMATNAVMAGIVKELANEGKNTVKNVQQALIDKFKSDGVFNVTFSNGAKVGMDAYVNMVARTARTESGNATCIDLGKKHGTGLVKCIGNSITCQVCAMYQNRVYSIDGEDKRFPPLREGANAPLKNGYNTIHPNCRCEFLPYFEEIQADEELARDMEKSNRPFEDNRTQRQQKAYQEWQEKNRQLRDELNEYSDMKAVLGDKLPYNTLGGFRRAKRAFNELKNSDTLDKEQRILYNNYRRTKLAYKDKLLQNDIRGGRKNLTVESGKQGKHIQGHNNFKQGKSYLTIDEKETQNLVKQYAGTGEIVRDSNEKWSNKERVSFDSVIGVNVNTKKQHKTLTTHGTIHYSQSGTHLVPTAERLQKKSVEELKITAKKIAVKYYDTNTFQKTVSNAALSAQEKEKRIDALLSGKVSKNSLIKDIKSMEKKILRERGDIR